MVFSRVKWNYRTPRPSQIDGKMDNDDFHQFSRIYEGLEKTEDWSIL